MSLSLIILLVCIALFALRGYFKGFFSILVWGLELIAGYLALVFWFSPVVQWLEQSLGLRGFIVYLLAGLTLFFGVGALVGLLLKSLQKILTGNQAPSAGSRLGGLAAGGVLGAIGGLIIIYGLSLYHEFREYRTDAAAQQQAAPAPAGDALDALPPLERGSRLMVAGATRQLTRLVSPDAAPLTGALMESPVAMTRNVQSLAANQDVRSLFQDQEFQAILSRGDTEAALRDPRFRELLNLPEVRYVLQRAGTGLDRQSSDQQVAEWVVNAWQGVDEIRNDEGVQAIVNDPRFQQKLQSGDRLSLMTDPQMKTLMERFFNAVPKATD